MGNAPGEPKMPSGEEVGQRNLKKAADSRKFPPGLDWAILTAASSPGGAEEFGSGVFWFNAKC